MTLNENVDSSLKVSHHTWQLIFMLNMIQLQNSILKPLPHKGFILGFSAGYFGWDMYLAQGMKHELGRTSLN